MHQEALQKLIRFFETISPDNTAHLAEIYIEDIFFKDPFNEVHDIASVMRIFEHMFVQVDSPRFVVTSHLLQGNQAFLSWDFLFCLKRFDRKEQCIRGATHLRFAADGRVNFHRDYWDAAEELYEKLPVIGLLMRTLKKMARN